jgi:tetratricopeptide (TPR) repeat protein
MKKKLILNLRYIGLLVLVVLLSGCAYATENMRASRYINRGDPDHAITILNKLISRKHDDYLTYYYLANAYMVKGENEQSLTNFNKSIKKNPSYYYAQINKGVLLARMDKDTVAIGCFDKAASLKPDAFDPYFRRGRVYHRKCEYKKAMANYEKALAIRPEDLNALLYKARLYYDIGQFKKATTAYDYVLKLYPNSPKVLDEYAWTLVICDEPKYRDPEKAIKLSSKAVKEFPSSVSFDTLAAVYAAEGRFSKAILFQSKAVELLETNRAKDRNYNEYLTELNERLKFYEQGKKWKEPKGAYRKFSINPI